MAKFTPKLNDKKEFNRLKARAKRVIKRAKQHGFDISGEIDLPRSITAFNTRKEFNSYMEKLNKWSHPSNMAHQYVKTKHGDYITKKEEFTYNQLISIINEKRKKENKKIKKLRKNLGINPDGTIGKQVVIHKKIYNVTDDGLQQLLVKTGQPTSRQSFLKRLGRREKQAEPQYMTETQERMKENVLDVMLSLYGDEAKPIIEKMRNMEFEDFYTMYRNNDEFKDVMFGSPKTQLELAESGIVTTYRPPQVEELEAIYEIYMKRKNEANNK